MPLGYKPLTISAGVLITCPFSLSPSSSLSDSWQTFTPQVRIWAPLKFQILSATGMLTHMADVYKDLSDRV